MAVDATLGGSVTLSKPIGIAKVSPSTPNGGSFEVMTDGRLPLVDNEQETGDTREVRVVLNGFGELTQNVPAKYDGATYIREDRTMNRPSTRRQFIHTSLGTLGAAALPVTQARQANTPYVRHNVASAQGQAALRSYARGVNAMLKLPADHPQNWFRHAFIHIMDCPHGNWWFYVWHRGYLAYFEQTIRTLSGDSSFALPYWDWTYYPRIPDAMFGPALTPADIAFAPFTRNLDVFTKFIRPALMKYWSTLNAAQRQQLDARGYTDFKLMWDDVTGLDPKSPKPHYGISGNVAYANPCGARYLTRDNPALDARTTHNCGRLVVFGGLLANAFYSTLPQSSFNSSKKPSHNASGSDKGTHFSILEAFPHNKVHNYIGGVGPLDPGPYGYMTNFLSPVDPVFFLHHSNMDRLWDVWTRRMIAMKLSPEPAPADMQQFMTEPFLFFVDSKGNYLTNGTAADYFRKEPFNYVYEPGFGEDLVRTPALTTQAPLQIPGSVSGDRATVSVPAAAIRSHLATQDQPLLFAEVTLTRTSHSVRAFDVLVGSAADLARADADIRHHAGTISFFGRMMHEMDGMESTFLVPLPQSAEMFGGLGAGAANVTLDVRVVPSNREQADGASVTAVTIRSR